MSESPLKVTLGSVRLTGDQAQRLLSIHRNKAMECREHWDWRLSELGLVVIGPMPAGMRRAREKWIAGAWTRARRMCGVKVPSMAKIREVEGLLNQMNHAAYGLDRKYSTLTKIGAELASNGRVVIMPKNTPQEAPDAL